MKSYVKRYRLRCRQRWYAEKRRQTKLRDNSVMKSTVEADSNCASEQVTSDGTVMMVVSSDISQASHSNDGMGSSLLEVSVLVSASEIPGITVQRNPSELSVTVEEATENDEGDGTVSKYPESRVGSSLCTGVTSDAAAVSEVSGKNCSVPIDVSVPQSTNVSVFPASSRALTAGESTRDKTVDEYVSESMTLAESVTSATDEDAESHPPTADEPTNNSPANSVESDSETIDDCVSESEILAECVTAATDEEAGSYRMKDDGFTGPLVADEPTNNNQTDSVETDSETIDECVDELMILAESVTAATDKKAESCQIKDDGFTEPLTVVETTNSSQTNTVESDSAASSDLCVSQPEILTECVTYTATAAEVESDVVEVLNSLRERVAEVTSVEPDTETRAVISTSSSTSLAVLSMETRDTETRDVISTSSSSSSAVLSMETRDTETRDVISTSSSSSSAVLSMKTRDTETRDVISASEAATLSVSSASLMVSE